MATFQDVILNIPGLTHYYPLNEDARDIVGGLDGIVHGNVQFDGTWARFDGSCEIELPPSNDFSAAGSSSKSFSVVVFQTVDDWTKRSDNNEYIHWMGKGKSGAHEWTFRYYCDGCGGEAPQRPHRTSFYNFNPEGGLGTGSYFQDPDGNGVERVITGTVWGNAGNGGKTEMWKNGERRDSDLLSEYDVYPEVTDSRVFMGSRGDNTGNLVGRLRRVAFFDRVLTDAEIKSIYNARSYEEGTGSGSGGGTTPPAPEEAIDFIVGGESHPIDGLNVPRGTDQLIIYTGAHGSVSGTNEWGAEVRVESGVITEILDQRESPASPNLPLDRPGYVASGHGLARVWLLDNAAIGVRAGFTGLILPETPPSGGGGGGGTTPPPTGGGDCDLTDINITYDTVTAALDALVVATKELGDAIAEAG